MAVSELANDVGYKGAAICAAFGAALLAAVQLRRFHEQAPLVRWATRGAVVGAVTSAVLSLLLPDRASTYAVIASAVFTTAASALPLDRFRAGGTLAGIALIVLGVAVVVSVDSDLQNASALQDASAIGAGTNWTSGYGCDRCWATCH